MPWNNFKCRWCQSPNDLRHWMRNECWKCGGKLKSKEMNKKNPMET